MTTAMYHRGPDAEGFLTASNAALGVRRLSIIDRASGDQPIYNTGCAQQRLSGRAVATVFNGEIYNYGDLTSELKDYGHRFKTSSDTEAIIHAYEQWGPDCVHRLRGMFAFCIVDGPESWEARPHAKVERVFLARDRLGIKPLYYHRRDGFFVVASEVRALLASDLVSWRPSLEGLTSYLAYGSVQEPLTLVDDVYSLPPGHWMNIDLRHGTFDLHQYWDLPTVAAQPPGTEAMNEQEIIAHLHDLLSESVRLRLVSEVPLGAFLSGGIDSGAVVSLMSDVGAEPPRTFNITFNESEFSEAGLARETAKRSRADHHEIVVTGEEVLADLPQAFKAVDQPSIDGINTYYVSRAVKQTGLTVALTGLGGDEIFGGYEGFRTVPQMLRFQRAWDRVPGPLRRLSAGAWSVVGPRGDRHHKLAAFLAGDVYFSHPYYASRMLFTPRQTSALLHQGPGELTGDDPWSRRVEAEMTSARRLDPINAVSYLECKNYLASTLLRDTDSMSMAHSLEVRVPLIDHTLVEFMMRLPGHIKMNNAMPKHLLVKALNGALAPEVVNRPKGTFTFPWDTWLRHEMRSQVEETLYSPPRAVVGLLNMSAVTSVWQRFLDKQTSWSRPWSLYVLFKWMEQVTR